MKRAGSSLIVAAVLALPLGCSNNSGSGGSAPVASSAAPVVEAPAPKASAAEAPKPHRPRMPRMALGPSMMLFAAAEDLPSLKPEQKAAIEKLDEPPAPGAFRARSCTRPSSRA